MNDNNNKNNPSPPTETKTVEVIETKMSNKDFLIRGFGIVGMILLLILGLILGFVSIAKYFKIAWFREEENE